MMKILIGTLLLFCLAVKVNINLAYWIFARQIKVDNIYKGITNIATVFGFMGVGPYTIMMGWPKGLANS